MGNEHSTSRPMRECVPVSSKFKRKTEWESVHAWAYPRIAYTATETNVRWRGKSPSYRKVVLLLRLLASRSWSQVVRACWPDGNSTYMPQWKQKDLFPLTPSVTLSGYCSISQLGGVDNHLGHWLLYNEEESCQNYKENDSWVDTLFDAFLNLVTAWLMRSLTNMSPLPQGTTTLTGPK